MPKAYSYIRFSTVGQSKGDSFRRQLQLSEDYAKKHGLTLDELKLHDLGLSAYTGTNVSLGRLGAFLKLAESGQIEKGSYLLVEAFDRLSRQEIRIAMSNFLRIVNSGIRVVTLSDAKVWEENTLDMTDMILSVMSMGLAHKHSDDTSKRLKKVWEHKRSIAKDEAMTKWVPSWLMVDDFRRIIPVPERVEQVQQIFAWAKSGMGQRLILQEIEKAGWKPWGGPINVKLDGENSVGSRRPQSWHGSLISRILTSKAVLGQFQPRSNRKDVNDAVQHDVFPSIITEELFHEVQALRKNRRLKGHGPRSTNVPNIFTGLLKCGYGCGGNTQAHSISSEGCSVNLIDKGKKSNTKYLVCSWVNAGHACCKNHAKYWRYDSFEEAFVRHVSEIDITQIFSRPSELMQQAQGISSKILSMEGRNIESKRNEDKIMAAIEGNADVPKRFTALLLKEERLQEELTRQIGLLESERMALQEKILFESEHKKDFDSLLLALEANTPDKRDKRLRLSQMLQDIVASIDIYSKGLSVSEGAFTIANEMVLTSTGKSKAYWQQVASNGLPFFIVNYKNGEKRMVMPHPKNNQKALICKKLGNQQSESHSKEGCSVPAT